MYVVSEHKIPDVTIARCVRLSRRLHCQQSAQRKLVQLLLQEWKPAQSKWSSLRVVHLEDQRFEFSDVVKCTNIVHSYKINEQRAFMNFDHKTCKIAKLSSLAYYEIPIGWGHFYWVTIATHALDGLDGMNYEKEGYKGFKSHFNCFTVRYTAPKSACHPI